MNDIGDDYVSWVCHVYGDDGWGKIEKGIMEYLCIMLNVINDDGCVNCMMIVRWWDMRFFFIILPHFSILFPKYYYFSYHFQTNIFPIISPPFFSYTYMDFHSYRISYKFIIQSIFFQNRIFGKLIRNSIEKLYRIKIYRKKRKDLHI